MYETFTEKARKVMQLANQEAQRLNHEYIGTEHILLGLIKEGSGVAGNVLKNLEIDLGKIRLEVEKIVMSGPDTVTMGQLPQTPRAKKVIEYAIEEARNLNHNYVGTEHLLLGLLREQEGVAAQVLMNLGLNLQDVREEVLDLLGQDALQRETKSAEVSIPPATKRTPTLVAFGLDLTEEARRSRLTPLVGRESELQRLRLVLACKTRNSPVLVGPPGVGKSALVKGLAQESDRERRLIAVSVDRMLAHAKEPAKFENSFLDLLVEVMSPKNIVIYFNDLRSLLSPQPGWTLAQAAGAFRSALAQGNLQCIATATPDVYHSTIAADGVLARRFRPIFVQPPSAVETLAILRQLRPLYESHHRVQIRDDALVAALDLSDRNLPRACQPGKAVQVLDEAGALVNLRQLLLQRPRGWRELQEQIKDLTRRKVKLVETKEFEKAAELRDQVETLKKRLQSIAAQQERREPESAGVVDAEVVAEAVHFMVDRPPEHRQDGMGV